MGLIKEPKTIDFTVLDQPWTTEEKKELSMYIKLQKTKSKKSKASLPKLAKSKPYVIA